jgi:hypothetical protein
VKEYQFPVQIYHIIWELQVAELPENALQHERWSKLLGLDPVSGSAMAVVRAIPRYTETPERLPDIHEGLPNLAESNETMHRENFATRSVQLGQQQQLNN